LLAFDVTDPANPQLASSLNFNPTNAWGFSTPRAAGGLLYFSHEQSTWNARSGGCWRVNDLLDVIDYTDPAAPTIRPPVSIPGQLVDVSSDGATLYLLGNALRPGGASIENRTAVCACAYDGVGAYLVSSLPLPQTWPQPVVVSDNFVYLGRAAANGTNGTLESWQFTAQGKFAHRETLALSRPLYALAAIGNALAGRDADNTVRVFDISAGLSPLGSAKPPGCIWVDLNRADGSTSSGLCVPIDDYGVFQVPPGP
jgi:hypothetical protein